MAAKTFLAGDLGGTKTLLSIYREIDGQLKQEHSHRYRSADWQDLESMLKQAPQPAGSFPHLSANLSAEYDPEAPKKKIKTYIHIHYTYNN